MKNLSIAFLWVLAMVACTPKTGHQAAVSPIAPEAPVVYDDMGKPIVGEDEIAEYHIMNEVKIKPEDAKHMDSLPVYRASSTERNDLLHTKISISFDWGKARANAVATLTLRPWFYTTDHLVLDAKNFDIHSISMESNKHALKYSYDNEQIDITLDRPYNRNENYTVVIDYTAKPDERTNIGGSAAITSDKGLYFINPDGADPEKPQQIWTQGETESNSCWFPTIDKPNERCTQEMYITVDAKYKTLSNGLLLSSTNNPDGTRTDYWKMDKPHAPYLFMMAIGDFAVVHDKWRGLDVDYYVEPKFESYARDIFPYTPEMLEFFSAKLNYEFPWSKFSQVVVRDYVSGAMENTTAVLFGEFVQKDRRSLMDDHLTNEKVVAHEMFHQWFGDLVTTESWSNITLNEGFANYSEYLWMEHKYGRDAADAHEMTEQRGYFFSATDGGHPLIDFGYSSREDMFDAHSYNKGGAILHMLRTYVGDDAFFTSLSKYLHRNEYSDVEAHELRLAFEDVTGEDLNWFFNQWFYSTGHPILDIAYKWDPSKQKAEVTVAQQQEGENIPYIFNLPLAIDIYDANGNVRREQIRITQRTQRFVFDAPTKPAIVNFDADKALLAIKTDRHTAEEWVYLYEHGPLFRDRMEALEALEEMKAPEAKRVYELALNDKSVDIRLRALHRVGVEKKDVLTKVADMAANAPEPEVRAAAIAVLAETNDKQYIPVLKKGLEPTQAYSVVGASLDALMKLDPPSAVEASKVLENEENETIVSTLASLYAKNPSRDKLAWFQKQVAKADFMSAFEVFEQYQKYLVALNDPALIDEAIQNWKAMAMGTKDSPFRRFSATKAIADTRSYYRDKKDTEKVSALNQMINAIKEQETDPTLKMYYGMF